MRQTQRFRTGRERIRNLLRGKIRDKLCVVNCEFSSSKTNIWKHLAKAHSGLRRFTRACETQVSRICGSFLHDCQTACWSHGIHPHRQARPRLLDVGEASKVARCDRVRRSGINLVVDGSHPPRSGADSEASFHGDQHGVHVRNISCERSGNQGGSLWGHDLTRHRGMVSTFCSARTRAQYGLRSVRVGEAHPGPASKRRRTLWLRALQRSMDSDGESSEDDARPTQLDRSLSEGDQQFVVRPPPSDVVDALEQDLVDARPPQFPRRCGSEARCVAPRIAEQPRRTQFWSSVMMNESPQQWLQAVVRTVHGWQRLTSQLTIRTATQCLILPLFWRRAMMPRMCTIS